MNLRDHGTSHHLNKGLFHSCLLDEVIGAIGFIRKTCSDNRKTFLCGFSLGGNFSLRVAARVQESAVKLDKVVAICPVLSPPSTLESLENGVFFYRKYFLRKWRKSLVKKQRIFPDDYTFNNTAAFKTLTGMTDYFVTKYTEFPNLETYLKGYALTGDMLSGIKIPAHIIASMDDPVIPCQDLEALARPQNVTVTLTRFGGHCGFITGPGMKSWVDDALVELVSNDI